MDKFMSVGPVCFNMKRDDKICSGLSHGIPILMGCTGLGRKTDWGSYSCEQLSKLALFLMNFEQFPLLKGFLLVMDGKELWTPCR